MEGEADWEQLYWDARCQVIERDLEIAKMKRDMVAVKREAATSLTFPVAQPPQPGAEQDPLYKNSIAPKDADLPVIMTMCNPAERRQLMKKVRARIGPDGSWRGGYTGKPNARRPAVQIVTERALEEQQNGTRLQKKRKNKNSEVWVKPRTQPYVTHVVLIDAGFYPDERSGANVASHLCHNNQCIIASHLEWSTATDNAKRERMCRPYRICKCELPRKCDFTLHDAEEK